MFPLTSSRMAGTSGSFGWAGCAAAAGRAELAAVGEPFSAGAAGSPAGAVPGSPGLTGMPVIFPPVLSILFCLSALGVSNLTLALVVDGAGSVTEAMAVSGLVCAPGLPLADSALFFVAGWVSVLAGALGIIEAILSFSTSTYPKSVLTLNMFSSYETITP